MVKPADLRNRDHLAAVWRLGGASIRAVFVERQMRPRAGSVSMSVEKGKGVITNEFGQRLALAGRRVKQDDACRPQR